MFIKTKYEITQKQCENVKGFPCHDRPKENGGLNLQVPWALLSFIVTFSPLLAVSPTKNCLGLLSHSWKLFVMKKP